MSLFDIERVVGLKCFSKITSHSGYLETSSIQAMRNRARDDRKKIIFPELFRIARAYGFQIALITNTTKIICNSIFTVTKFQNNPNIHFHEIKILS